MKFSILTIHPQLVSGLCTEGLLAKAGERRLLDLKIVNIRDFAEPPHFRVDDSPYGGGPGMVMKPEPIVKSIRSVVRPNEKTRIVLLAAKGKRFTQKTAMRWSRYEHIVLICGRYEGIDERVIQNYADEEVRIGDYILMGGELAAGVVVESVGRLIPGVLGNPKSLEDESFSRNLEVEYEQYTRPPQFEGHAVPGVLLKGNHAHIQKWRAERSRTKLKRTLPA